MELQPINKGVGAGLLLEDGSRATSNAGAARAGADLSRRQLAKNVAANLAAFGFGTISAFFLTPYWIRSFGVAGYGLVPLIANLVACFALISFLVNSSIARFLTIAVAQKNYAQAARVFNTSLIGSLAAGALMAIAGAAILPFIGGIIHVPAGFEPDVRIMFAFVLLTLIVSTCSTAFGTAIFCSNQLNLNSWIDVLNRGVAMTVSVGLVAAVYARPGAVSAGAFAGALCVAAANVHYWRRLMPWMKIRLGDFDWQILREQAAYGLWIVINQFGAILFLYVDLFVANRALGAFAAGQYAALLQWSILLRAFATALAAPFAPAAIHQFAAGDRAALVKHLRLAIRVVGLAVALPVALIAGFAQPLLDLWLGPGFAGLGPLLALMIIPLGLNLAALPLLTLQQAANQVKVPALATCALGVANFGLALFLATRAGWGMYGVAAAGALMLTAKNVLFTTWHASRILQERWTFFLGEIARVAALTAFLLLAAQGLVAAWPPQSWPELALRGFLIASIYGAGAWLLALNPDEKAFLLAKARRGHSGKP